MAHKLAALLRDPRHQIAAVMPSEESCRLLLLDLQRQRPDGTYHATSRRFTLPEGGSVQLAVVEEHFQGQEYTAIVVDEWAKPRLESLAKSRIRPLSPCHVRAYDDAEQARVVAGQMGRKHGVPFTPEACSACGKYHVRRFK
jgi:uncharacterized protein YqiB (DUF1249 family)